MNSNALLEEISTGSLISSKDLLALLTEALHASRRWADGKESSNATTSAYFCSTVGKNLHELLKTKSSEELKLSQIAVHENGLKKSGEWLLDAVIAKENQFGLISQIIASVECESNTALEAFHWDFAKLLHVNSSLRVFLNGLNHKTARGADVYVQKRLRYIENILRDLRSQSTWYIAFWPSPASQGAVKSIWNNLHDNYRHISHIRLFKYTDGQMTPILD